MSDSAELNSHRASLLHRRGFVTEESVYGIVVTSGLIAATGGPGADLWTVFTTVVATILVFWAAHVYAGTIAGRRGAHDLRTTISADLRHSLERSAGFLLSAMVPSLILLLGALEVVNDSYAIWAALWSCVAILAFLGFFAFRRYNSGWLMCVIGAIVTTSFGIAVILLKALIH
ncbi:MAG: hypothetical protein ABWY57_17415 [Mycetocola sp.]